MAQVIYEVSTAFLARMRAVIVAENPALQGQTNAVLNEAARVKARQLIRTWVNDSERFTAAVTSQSSVPVPTDADIL